MGFRNVRAMNQTSKTKQFIRQIGYYLIVILGLSELRPLKNGLNKFGDEYATVIMDNPSVRHAGVRLLILLISHKAMTN